MSETESLKKPIRPISRGKWLFDNVISLLLALALVFAIRWTVIEAFKIPSGSMIPTLLIGDHIFVNKFAYGVRLPFDTLVADDPVVLIKRDPPKRGDIIVFKYPKDESYYYIKRVVGVPGDTIEIRNRMLYVNGQLAPREATPQDKAKALFDDLDDPKYSTGSLELFQEKIDAVTHPILLDKSNFLGETFNPVTVPPESLFVMGDNRDFSNDSRFWGFVPFKNVMGKAMVIWLSLWFNLSDGDVTFRPTRTGTILN